MSTFTPPADLQPLVLAKSSDINDIVAATKAAFDLLPSEQSIQTGTVNYAVDTGTVNNYVVTIAPTVITSYSDGLLISIRPINSNTGAATININGLGIKSIKLVNGSDLLSGDITANAPIDMRYSAATGFFYIQPNSGAKAQIAADQAVIATNQAQIATNQAVIATNQAIASLASQLAANTSATIATNGAAFVAQSQGSNNTAYHILNNTGII